MEMIPRLPQELLAVLSAEDRALYESGNLDDRGLSNPHSQTLRDAQKFLSGRFDLRGCDIFDVRWSTPSAFARQSLLYLQTCSDVRFGSSYYTVRSGLHSWMLLETLEGEGLLRYEGRAYTLRPGDVFYLDCRLLHDYRTGAAGTWRYRLAHFAGAGAQNFFQPVHQSGNVVFPVGGDEEWSRLFCRLFQFSRDNQPKSELQIHEALTGLLSRLLQTLPQFDVSLQPQRIREICAYLSEHAAEPLDLGGIAAQFSLSKYHLSREFHRCTGDTIFGYIRAERLNLARQLLRGSELTVADVAESAGFSDQACFCRAFRQAENLSPSAYRRQWRAG